MESRINQINANGTDAEIEIFNGLPHGFGLGRGTIAEGWIDHAIILKGNSKVVNKWLERLGIID